MSGLFRLKPVLRTSINLHEDLARFGTVAGADDAAGFEEVHHAGGAAVAEAEATLEEAGGGFLFLSDDLDALLEGFGFLGAHAAAFAFLFTIGEEVATVGIDFYIEDRLAPLSYTTLKPSTILRRFPSQLCYRCKR